MCAHLGQGRRWRTTRGTTNHHHERTHTLNRSTPDRDWATPESWREVARGIDRRNTAEIVRRATLGENRGLSWHARDLNALALVRGFEYPVSGDDIVRRQRAIVNGAQLAEVIGENAWSGTGIGDSAGFILIDQRFAAQGHLWGKPAPKTGPRIHFPKYGA